MKVYVVWMDGEREFASCFWHDAKSRYFELEYEFGEDRVDMTVEYI